MTGWTPYNNGFFMEKGWDKKQIDTLLSGDEKTQEAFIHEFAPGIYTWIYYQVGADEQIAVELTGETFGKAVRNLRQFNPAEETLFQRLKQQARKTRDKGLEHRQMKPQRPWAWSQLPKEVLDGLAKLRSESLTEKVFENPFVHEIIQATLSELEPQDRELLIHRYSHLDAPEHIAEEIGCSIEDVQSRLYRCRHSFRRVFFQLLSAANLGFSESNATGEIETLDTNLEKLLSATTTYQSPDESKIDTIRQALLEAMSEIRPAPPGRPSDEYHRPAVITAVVLILIAGLYWITRKPVEVKTPPDDSMKTTETVPETKTPKPKPDDPKTIQSDLDKEELELVFKLGKEGDLDALLEILKSGKFTSQAAAAFFIGKLADPSAIELLEQAEQQWYDEPTDDNPFAKAIDEILKRFPDAVPTVFPEEAEPKIKPETKKETPAAKIPAITGLVSDFSNQPVAGAVLELTKNTLFSKTPSGTKLASAVSNEKGLFKFTKTYKGAAFLTGKSQQPGILSITRSLWCKKDAICIVNLGGKPTLTGTVSIDGTPLANQSLYLSDAVDIPDASFSQELRTDSEGDFAFLGVPTGVYYLMNMGLDNRMHRLAMIEMPPQETFNVDLDIKTATISVDYPAEPNLVRPIEGALVYAMDVSDKLNRTQAVIANDGSILFDNILPGSYVMRLRLDSGVWVQQEVEVADGLEGQIIQVDPIPENTTALRGRFLGASPVNLFLTNANQQIHIDLTPRADGNYELESVPVDIYSLAAFVHGQLFEFVQIDLQEQPENTLDIDPDEILRSFSPLNVVVTDPAGLILSGAQVWLAGTGGTLAASTTGRGAFLAAPIGSYTLSAAYPGYPTQTLEIDLKPSSLLAEPTSENSVMIQLETR